MAIVIYDPDCGFCRVCLALLLSWDRPRRGTSDSAEGERRGGTVSAALRPLPLGTPEADRLLADLSPGERAASWHLIGDDPEAPAAARSTPSPPFPDATGTYSGLVPLPPAPARFSAGAALAPALRLLPGGGIPAALFARFPRATERGYRWVADHRGLLGRFVPARARRWADRVIAAHGGRAPSQ